MRALNAAKVQADFRARKQKEKQKAEAAVNAANANSDGTGQGAMANLKIRPGEKLGDYNRRVEQAMASDVAATARSEARKLKKRKRAEAAANTNAGSGDERDDAEASEEKRKAKADRAAAFQQAEPSSRDLKKAREEMTGGAAVGAKAPVPLDFAKASQTKRVNDVAQAPPTFTKLPRGESKEAKARKAAIAAALAGQDAQAASRKMLSSRERTVTKGQMPEPVARPGGLKKEKEMQEERERVIKLYRQRKEQRQRES